MRLERNSDTVSQLNPGQLRAGWWQRNSEAGGGASLRIQYFKLSVSVLWSLQKIECWAWLWLIKLKIYIYNVHTHIYKVTTMKLCKTRTYLPLSQRFEDLGWKGSMLFLNIFLRNQVIKSEKRSMRSFLQKMWQN